MIYAFVYFGLFIWTLCIATFVTAIAGGMFNLSEKQSDKLFYIACLIQAILFVYMFWSFK
jgi:hypothetical protein